MSRTAATVPAESDWLCEGCGYVLNGLPPGGRCPECGKATGESASELRRPPAWEDGADKRSGPVRFLATTADVLFHPTRFYRTLSTRESRSRSSRFGMIHLAITSALLGAAAFAHYDWFSNPATTSVRPVPTLLWWLALAGLTQLFILLTTRLAAHLTTWEATYRGIRLPLPVVLRGLDYHAAHYLPVALATAATVIGFRILLVRNPVRGGLLGPVYLYVLCGEVIVAAAYLFKTYWIGMRNMMYASR